MKNIYLYSLMTALALSGCSTETSKEENASLNNGAYLKIGIVGEKPHIQKENIKFEALTLEQLKDTKKVSSNFDAVFITKGNLKKADDEKYVTVYDNLKIPIFFLQTTKGFLPFVTEGLSYKEASELNHSYASGYLKEKKSSYRYWEYGLNDDVVNEKNINNVYSRIFKTVEDVKREKS